MTIQAMTTPFPRRQGVPPLRLEDSTHPTSLPFITMEFVDGDAFRQFTERIFDTDRDLVPKGMIEVMP